MPAPPRLARARAQRGKRPALPLPRLEDQRARRGGGGAQPHRRAEAVLRPRARQPLRRGRARRHRVGVARQGREGAEIPGAAVRRPARRAPRRDEPGGAHQLGAGGRGVDGLLARRRAARVHDPDHRRRRQRARADDAGARAQARVRGPALRLPLRRAARAARRQGLRAREQLRDAVVRHHLPARRQGPEHGVLLDPGRRRDASRLVRALQPAPPAGHDRDVGLARRLELSAAAPGRPASTTGARTAT